MERNHLKIHERKEGVPTCNSSSNSISNSNGSQKKRQNAELETPNVKRARNFEQRVDKSRAIENPSKFIEFWTPIHLSTVQQEIYCETLISNSKSLLNLNGELALRDVVFSLMKIVNHPGLVDKTENNNIIKDKKEKSKMEFSESGKFVILEKILKKIRKHHPKILIVFQSQISDQIDEVLINFLNEKFGENSHQNIDMNFPISQYLINSITKSSDPFIFLLDSNASPPSGNLSFVSSIIILNSSLDPLFDIRNLEKFFSFQKEPKPVFRFYSTKTIEEKFLILAKNNEQIDEKLERAEPSFCHFLLSHGATHIFNTMDKIRGYDLYDITEEIKFIDDVVREIKSEILLKSDCRKEKFFLVEAQINGTKYSQNMGKLVGEKDELAHALNVGPILFWCKLLSDRVPFVRVFSIEQEFAKREILIAQNLKMHKCEIKRYKQKEIKRSVKKESSERKMREFEFELHVKRQYGRLEELFNRVINSNGKIKEKLIEKANLGVFDQSFELIPLLFGDFTIEEFSWDRFCGVKTGERDDSEKEESTSQRNRNELTSQHNGDDYSICASSENVIVPVAIEQNINVQEMVNEDLLSENTVNVNTEMVEMQIVQLSSINEETYELISQNDRDELTSQQNENDYHICTLSEQAEIPLAVEEIVHIQETINEDAVNGVTVITNAETSEIRILQLNSNTEQINEETVSGKTATRDAVIGEEGFNDGENADSDIILPDVSINQEADDSLTQTEDESNNSKSVRDEMFRHLSPLKSVHDNINMRCTRSRSIIGNDVEKESTSGDTGNGIINGDMANYKSEDGDISKGNVNTQNCGEGQEPTDPYPNSTESLVEQNPNSDSNPDSGSKTSEPPLEPNPSFDPNTSSSMNPNPYLIEEMKNQERDQLNSEQKIDELTSQLNKNDYICASNGKEEDSIGATQPVMTEPFIPLAIKKIVNGRETASEQVLIENAMDTDAETVQLSPNAEPSGEETMIDLAEETCNDQEIVKNVVVNNEEMEIEQTANNEEMETVKNGEKGVDYTLLTDQEADAIGSAQPVETEPSFPLAVEEIINGCETANEQVVNENARDTDTETAQLSLNGEPIVEEIMIHFVEKTCNDQEMEEKDVVNNEEMETEQIATEEEMETVENGEKGDGDILFPEQESSITSVNSDPTDPASPLNKTLKGLNPNQQVLTLNPKQADALESVQEDEVIRQVSAVDCVQFEVRDASQSVQDEMMNASMENGDGEMVESEMERETRVAAVSNTEVPRCVIEGTVFEKAVINQEEVIEECVNKETATEETVFEKAVNNQETVIKEAVNEETATQGMMIGQAVNNQERLIEESVNEETATQGTVIEQTVNNQETVIKEAVNEEIASQGMMIGQAVYNRETVIKEAVNEEIATQGMMIGQTVTERAVDPSLVPINHVTHAIDTIQLTTPQIPIPHTNSNTTAVTSNPMLIQPPFQPQINTPVGATSAPNLQSHSTIFTDPINTPVGATSALNLQFDSTVFTNPINSPACATLDPMIQPDSTINTNPINVTAGTTSANCQADSSLFIDPMLTQPAYQPQIPLDYSAFFTQWLQNPNAIQNEFVRIQQNYQALDNHRDCKIMKLRQQCEQEIKRLKNKKEDSDRNDELAYQQEKKPYLEIYQKVRSNQVLADEFHSQILGQREFFTLNPSPSQGSTSQVAVPTSQPRKLRQLIPRPFCVPNTYTRHVGVSTGVQEMWIFTNGIWRLVPVQHNVENPPVQQQNWRPPVGPSTPSQGTNTNTNLTPSLNRIHRSMRPSFPTAPPVRPSTGDLQSRHSSFNPSMLDPMLRRPAPHLRNFRRASSNADVAHNNRA